jgi:colanic acid biosynthesis glycosyl transferase WcaI
MRILLLTQWFQPEPSFKGLPFAQALTACGHEVEVLTGFPNYPGGRIYPGYSIRFFQRETIGGIRVNRVPLYPSHNGSGLMRMLNYLSFCLSATLLGPFLIRRPDVIYVYNLPTLGFTAAVLRFLFGSKVVLDIQDLWPQSVIQSHMMNNRWVESILAKWTDVIYASSDHITVLSPGFRNDLIARGIPSDKISVIYNWCIEEQTDASEMSTGALNAIGADGTFSVVFAGTMGKMQALDAVLEAAGLIEKENVNIVFWFIGGGIEVENLKAVAASRGLSNVRFIPPMGANEIGTVLQKADALLVHLKKDPLFDITIPSKIQAYLHAGRPILAGVSGCAAQLVEDACAGIVCEPGDPHSIAAAVLKMNCLARSERANIGNNGSRYYAKELSRTMGVSKFEMVFSSLCEKSMISYDAPINDRSHEHTM